MIKKQMYEAPKIEVLELRMEGVIAQSITLDGLSTTYDGGGEDWDN